MPLLAGLYTFLAAIGSRIALALGGSFMKSVAWLTGGTVIANIVAKALGFLCVGLVYTGAKSWILPAFFSTAAISAAMAAVPQEFFYFANLAALDVGLSMIFAAYVASYIIKKVSGFCSNLTAATAAATR